MFAHISEDQEAEVEQEVSLGCISQGMRLPTPPLPPLPPLSPSSLPLLPPLPIPPPPHFAQRGSRVPETLQHPGIRF